MATENFTRALALTHNFNPISSSPHERLEAEEYLMQLRARPEGLNLAFHIISNEAVDEVRCFWAFNTVMHHLPSLAAVVPAASMFDGQGASGVPQGSATTPAVDDAQAEELYRTLFSFMYRYLFSPQQQSSPQQQQQQQQQQQGSTSFGNAVSSPSNPTASPISDFLINKHAQLMVVGLQCFYPSRWRGFFDDLFELLSRSGSTRPGSTDAAAIYFLRIFQYIDERVVSVRDRTLQERGKDMRARDMALKDAMRVQVIPRLVQTWFAILSEVRHRAPDIAFLCLSVVQTYIEWIDVNLLMTTDWINMFYFTMTVPPTTLRVAACECILSLVAKKQLPGIKMESLRTLSVVASLPRIVSMLTVPAGSDDDLLLIDAVARLVVAVAEQFLQLVEMCTSSSGSRPPSAVLIDAETGMNMVDIPFEVTAELVGSLTDAVHAVVAQLLRIYSIPHLQETRDICLPLLQTYLKSQVLQEHEAAQILVQTFHHMRVEGLAAHEDKVWDDAMIDHRKVLFNVVRLLYRRFPSLVLQHLNAVALGIVQERRGQGGGDGTDGPPAMDVSPNDSLAHIDFTHPEVVEAALHYVYEIGEAVKLETVLKDQNDPLCAMIAQLLTCEAIAEHQANPAVHLAFFEMMERYHLFFVYHAEFIPVLLQRQLLLPCGVTNRNDRVRGRICYLFSRMLSMLKGAMRPYAADMVHAIMTIVNASISNRAVAGSGNGAGGIGVLLPSDLRELCEATGTLLALLLGEECRNGAGEEGSAVGPAVRCDGDAGLAKQLAGMSSNGATGIQGGGAASADGGGSRCAALTSSVVQGMLQHLQLVTSQGGEADGAGGTQRAAARVADAISYLGALAKGLALSEVLGGAGGSSSGGNASRPSGSLTGSFVGATEVTAASTSAATVGAQQTAVQLAQLFASATQDHVMRVLASSWSGAPAVRDAGGQYLQQMLNTIPFELIAAVYEGYVELALGSMEAVHELARLLRLMYQFVNKSGPKGVPTVVRVTPAAWSKVLSLGELSSAASPVMVMGVVSESAREKLEVYKHFFAYIFSVATWGCAPAFLLMPEQCVVSILRELVEAVTLPTDLELPKAALQTHTKLTSELLGTLSATQLSSLQGIAEAPEGRAPSRLEMHVAQLASSPSFADADVAQAQTQLLRNGQVLQEHLLRCALPTVFRVILRPRPPPPPPVPTAPGATEGPADLHTMQAAGVGMTTPGANASLEKGAMYFDLSDGKNFLLLGEVGAFCRSCAHTPFGEQALQVMYECLTTGSEGRIPSEAAMDFCYAVRDQPRFNSALKVSFKQMLERAQL